jgi:protein TonB
LSATVRNFSLYHHPRASPRRWLGPTIVSGLAYAALGTALIVLAPLELAHVADRAIDVAFVNKMTFIEKVAKEEPPPEPPATAPVEAPPQAPAAMAPVVRPDQKVRHLEQPPPAKPLRAPRRMPTETPKEADPSEDKGIAMVGPGDKGDAAGLEGGVTQGGVVGGQVGGVVELPNDAVPPRLMPGNAVPPYPADARAARKTGVVILKVVVFADGTVGNVRVVDGQEPFVTAAVQTVKSWRYQPARYKGQPIAVYREVRIPFELKG